jgi:hypothetical protein
VGNGKSKPPLIEADSAFHVPQLHHLGAAGVRLEDDRPRDDAKVGAEACRDWQQFQPRRQHHLGKVGWSEVVMEMANLDRPPLGLLEELDSPAALLETPSPKGMSVPPMSSLEHCNMNKQFQ